MNDAELREAREAFRDHGEFTEPLLAELSRVVHGLVHFGHLPASYSPYGQWDDESEAEVGQEWIATKLLGGGGLAALFDRAQTASGFRGLAARSVRQHLLNARARSQSQNLYWRAATLLRDQDEFVVVRESSRPQEVIWAIAQTAQQEPVVDDDRRLLALAWSLGDFELIRYRAGAGKLSPVLSTPDLQRFVTGMLTSGGPMSLAQLARALSLRFNLGEIQLEPLEEDRHSPVSERPVDDPAWRELALAVIGEMTRRQVDVLLDTRAGESLEAMAERYGCSAATISNEQQRIEAIIVRHSEDDDDKWELLKIVSDLLYEYIGDQDNGMSSD